MKRRHPACDDDIRMDMIRIKPLRLSSVPAGWHICSDKHKIVITHAYNADVVDNLLWRRASFRSHVNL